MLDFDRIRDEVLELLGPYGVRRIAVFGSVARGEEEEGSDIDILVTFERPLRKPLGFRLAGIEQELGERLGRRVDLISEEALSPYIRPYVEEEEVVLYEEAS
ncbi:MAG: nucleotidyltransferase family protein [Anaerolineae bacterium]|nr:nucleotidyltransferase family protein [Anaerolineae bacterium]